MGRDAGFEVRLSGGPRQTIGEANDVADEVAAEPALAAELWEAVGSADDVVAGRAVDALEKASRTRPEVLEGHEGQILDELARSPLPEVRWHVGQLVPRLRLREGQVSQAAAVLEQLMRDTSRVAQALALDGLVTLADAHPELPDRAAVALTAALENPSPAVRARARHLTRR